MHKQPLFEARASGYRTYRVPGIAVSPTGVVIATAEARPGGGGDWDWNDIVIRRSADGGASWDDARTIVRSADYGAGPASNFCMIPDPQAGCVHAVFCHNYERVFATRTDDDGLSFAEPTEITATAMLYRDDYPWRVIATGPGHGLKSSHGRLIVPLWMSDGSGTEFGHGRLGHRPSIVGSVHSDDGGATWSRGEVIASDGQEVAYRGSTATIVNPSETVAVELSDGRILVTIRSESAPHKRLVAISADGSTGWSEPEFADDLLEPVCMASMIRLDARGGVLFANPDNLDHAMTRGNQVSCDRKRLSVKLSPDDCISWTTGRVIEEGPSGYSDLALLADGTVLCFYECGKLDGMTDTQYCMLAAFDRGWIEAQSPRENP